MASHIQTIDNFVYPIIQERKKLRSQDLEEKSDFLSRFMSLYDDKVRVLCLFEAVPFY